MFRYRSHPMTVMVTAVLLCLSVLSAGAKPLATYPFNQEALQNEGFISIPVMNYTAPAAESGLFLTNNAFSEGYRVEVKPGEATLLAVKDPVAAGVEPQVITLEYGILSGRVQLAVVGLNAPDGVPDHQLGYTLMTVEADPGLPPVRQLHLIYAAPSGQYLPAVQVSLDAGAAEPGVVVLYGFSLYPYVPADMRPLVSVPDGTFNAPDPRLLTNVNGDQGTVGYDVEKGIVKLAVPGQGAAANAGLRIQLPDTIQGETLLVASMEAGRISGGEGTTALVLSTGPWNAGVFVHNETLPVYPDTKTVWIGGYFPMQGETLYLFAQNGGGAVASELAVDTLWATAYSLQSIQGLEPVDTIEIPKSLAAAMILPKDLFSGSQGSFSLTAMDLESHNPVCLPYTVTLRSADQKITLARGVTNTKGFSSHTMTIPPLSEGIWSVALESGGETILKGQASVKNAGLLIIETDKPIYKPGQKIQGRVIFLNNSLQPLEGEIEVSISDAKGIKIHKQVLKANAFGVASFELPLANELNFGTWKITAQTGDDSKTELDIEVDKYVLPSFEVNLNLSKDWFLVSERIRGSVDCRYFFGQVVKGSVEIEALRYVGTWDKYATQSGTLTDGRFEFDLPPVVYTAGTTGAEGDGTLQLKVTVTDETGHQESTDAIARIAKAGVTLKMIPESEVIKPGLDQDILIISETPGGGPLSLPVQVEINFVGENGADLGKIDQSVDTQNGLAVFNYKVPAKALIAFITLRAKLDDNTQEISQMLSAAYSPGSYYIHLRQMNEGVLKPGDEAVFRVLATTSGTVFYDVYASGRTLFSNTAEGNEIRFPVTPGMSPSARLVAYMIQPNNEVSADVLPFDVEMTSTTRLNATFSAEEVKPGDPVTLSVQSEGQSMVGLALVDESVFALVKGRLNLRNVFAELERIFMEPQIEIHQDPNQGPIGYRTISAGKGSADILNDNNLQILTTEGLSVPKAQPMDPWSLWGIPGIRKNLPPEMLGPVADFDATAGGAEGQTAYQEPSRVRTFFPETWLWSPELLTDEQGSAVLNLTAPDSITTWKLHALSTSPKGVGITEGSLRVFQDFFVEPDLPYSVIRGDEFPMRVRVFNYTDSEQSIRITLEDPESLGLTGDAEQIIQVPGHSGRSAVFTLKPTTVGLLPVSLIAQSANRADALRKDLRVEPEGLRREIVHNGSLVDAAEVTIDLSMPNPLIRLPEDIPFEEIVVPDSEKLRVAVTASLLGQALDGLGDLLGMPYGCGEQNMIFLAPDIEILRYLKATGQSIPELRAKAEFFIMTGYQRELTFQRDDGSFSAFGQQDESGSLWLTAFVLSTFSNAREVQTIDDTVLANAAKWITDRQKADGSWEPVGFVIHSELVGGQNGNLALSAFVTMALLEYGHADPALVKKAVSYLESQITAEKMDSYVLSLITYALMKAGSPAADTALEKLIGQAIVDGNGTHWEPHPIETTGYAAMALTAKNRVEAQSALRWLAAQRNSLGGYGTTQDTVVALKALTAAAVTQSRNLDARVEVIVNGQSVKTFTLNEANFDVLQALELAPADQITLKSSGKGTVMYQILHAFNIPVFLEPVGQDMLLTVKYSTDHIQVDDIVDVQVTVNYMGIEKKTSMAIVDVSVPTGFSVLADSLNRVRGIQGVSRIEQAGRKIIFYLESLTSGEPFEFAFQVKADMPVKVDSGTSAAYLYYKPETRAETGGVSLIVE
ncbi:MAG TPA: alpha-2-macroglobulin family protein [bacterium]|nr:alpha-2-macroglobulin family protein [bacterium]